MDHQHRVLLLHGFTSHRNCIYPLRNHLAKLGYQVITPLLPGHETSPQDLAQTIWRDWLESARYHLLENSSKEQPLYLIGHSMGGALALDLAAQHPSRIKKLVTAVPALKLKPFIRYGAPLLKNLFSYAPARFQAEEPQAYERNQNYAQVPLKALASLVHYGKLVLPKLSKIQSPTLVFANHRDPLVDRKTYHFLEQKISLAPLEIEWVAQGYHEVFLDLDAPKICQQIADFLKA